MKNTSLAIVAIVLAIILLLSIGGLLIVSGAAKDPGAPSAEALPEETIAPTGEPDAEASEKADEPAKSVSPAPETTSEPEDDSSSENLARAQEIMSGMSLHEKICQLFVVYPDALTGVSGTTLAGDKLRLGLEEYPVGGLVFAQANIESEEAIRFFIDNAQQFSEISLFMCSDEEGGDVARLLNVADSVKMDAMYTYKDEGGETARENAKTIAALMAGDGFNLDLAPVADVWSNKENTVIGTRAYSDDFSEAAELIPYAVSGFHEGGVACCLKHFPGHGDTAEDTHKTGAVVHKSLEELENEELLPFVSGIEAGADMVMTSHVTLTALDAENPASLSYAVTTGLLRETLGFDGVVITDSLQMKALDGYTGAQRAVLAVQAGADLLLGPEDLAEAVTALEDAVSSGAITEERINESVLRILRLKLARGIEE